MSWFIHFLLLFVILLRFDVLVNALQHPSLSYLSLPSIILIQFFLFLLSLSTNPSLLLLCPPSPSGALACGVILLVTPYNRDSNSPQLCEPPMCPSRATLSSLARVCSGCESDPRAEQLDSSCLPSASDCAVSDLARREVGRFDIRLVFCSDISNGRYIIESLACWKDLAVGRSLA